MIRSIQASYIARCHKTLKGWGAPLENWVCTAVYDVNEDGDDGGLAICELCGCKKVRYVHIMEHHSYFEHLEVGCICAGIMEDDILASKERERLVRNRTKRKNNFTKREWKLIRSGLYFLYYRGKQIFIHQHSVHRYSVRCGKKSAWEYKGKRIDNPLSAIYAAFDLVDPPIEQVFV